MIELRLSDGSSAYVLSNVGTHPLDIAATLDGLSEWITALTRTDERVVVAKAQIVWARVR